MRADFDFSKILVCDNCGRQTAKAEAEQRIISPGRCGRCRGSLTPWPESLAAGIRSLDVKVTVGT